MVDIHATLTRGEADVQVVNETYGGMRYFKPLSERAADWFEENLEDESSFLNGELVVEHRYADDMMAGLADAGMVFFVPQWMDNPPALCDGCHEPIKGAALDEAIARHAGWRGGACSRYARVAGSGATTAGRWAASGAYPAGSAAGRREGARRPANIMKAMAMAWS